MCAAFTGQKYGSARQALKRLYKAGDIARDAGATSVTEVHMREADKRVEKGKVRDELGKLPTQEKLTLYLREDSRLEDLFGNNHRKLDSY